MNMDGACFICNTLETHCPQKGQGRYLGKKAIEMLLNMSTTREDNQNKKLSSAGNDDVWVFNSCYKAYTDSRQKFKQDKAGEVNVTRHAKQNRIRFPFDYKTHC